MKTIKDKLTTRSHHITLEPVVSESLTSWIQVLVEAETRERAESIAIAMMASPRSWKVVKYGKAFK